MRNFLVIIFLTMFVGNHGLENWVNPLHGNAGAKLVSTSAGFSGSYTVRSASLITIDLKQSNCCPANILLMSTSAAHCVADCGLSARSVLAGSIGSMFKQLVQLKLPKNLIATSDHFRPPIA